MSGAAVFADQVLIGIVSLVGKEGDRHQLRVLPIDRLFARDDVAQALDRSGHSLPPKVDLGKSRSAQASSWNWPRQWDFSGYVAEKRHGFTGRPWLFSEVREWYKDAKGAQALLVCADFGVGKSAFMAELTFEPRGLQIAAYHFCVHYLNATLDPAEFVRSIAAQLGDTLPAYRFAVDADTDACRWLDDAQRDPASAFERAVIRPLNAISSPAAPQVLLIDGLDEALDFELTSGSSSPTTIVRLLAAQARHLPPWLRVLATSRRIQEIKQLLQSTFDWRSMDGEGTRNLNDIRDYVAGRCAGVKLASVLGKGNRSATEIASFLSGASGGKFLYAVRVLNDLESGALPLDRLRDLPPGMDGFYLDAFARRFPESEDYAPVASLLGVLCVEREPMPRAELAAILGTSEAQIGTILRRLEDFLNVRAKRYAFDHLSLTQWLSEENEDGFPRAGRFSVDANAAGGLIAGWARRELAADRAHESEYLARHLGSYLSRPERKAHFAQLLSDFRWVDARLRAAGVNALLMDFADVDGTPALNAVERALRQSAHVLGHDGGDWSGPDLLASQMLGRLQSQAVPEIHDLCAQAAEKISRNAGLRPLTDSLRSVEALLRTLEGHTEPVTAFTVLADGRLASGSDDQTIRLWNPTSGVCESTLKGHTKAITALVVLADGRLASASSDSTIRLWNPKSGVCEATLRGHKYSVNALAVLAGGRLASASDRVIRLWNTRSGAYEATLQGHTGKVLALVVLTDGRLASASEDHTIRIWNPSSRRACEAKLEGHSHSVVSELAVLPDGRLASGSNDHAIRLWNLASRVCEATLEGHTGSITALAVLADGRLASGSWDETMRLWNPTSGACEATLEGLKGTVYALAALPTGQLVSGADTIRIWNPASGVCAATLILHAEVEVAALAELANGWLAMASDRTIRLRNPASGALEATLEGHTRPVGSFAVLADGRLASGSDDHTIRLWNTTTGVCEAILGGHDDRVSALAVLADGRLASGSDDHTIRLWNPVSGVCEATLEGHTKRVEALVVLADGRLASGAWDRTIRLWNPASRTCEATLEAHTDWVSALAVLADGRLASGSKDGVIRLWNPVSGAWEETLEGHTGTVGAFAVLADGRLASGSWDRTIRVWQIHNGRWTGTVQFAADVSIYALAFAARAGVLAAGDMGGRVHFLRVEAATGPG
jgi:WD40 repeat protein